MGLDNTPSNIAPPRRPAWYKAGQRQIDLFTKTLHNKLVDLPRPFCLDCINVNCSHVEQHSSDRDDYVLDLLSTAIEVSHLTIPMTSGVKKKVNPEKEHFVSKNIPGWQEHVKEFRDDSIFWHSIWISCGRPNKGVVHSIMSSTRNKYHYAIRRVKKLSEEIRAKNLFSASLQGDINLLKEMKKIKGSKKESLDLPDTVEDANGPDEIVDKFREVYEDLYNSADTSEAMNLIKDQLRLMIGQDSVTEVNKVTPEVVKKAAACMKSNKSDVTGSYTSDLLLHAPDSMFAALAAIFRSWLVHGTVTRNLLVCAFMPLLKSALKDPASRDSYRAIAGSSQILKLFDNDSKSSVHRQDYGHSDHVSFRTPGTNAGGSGQVCW